MMNTILFDLDNTLYPERTYVESGFKEVSNYLSKKYNLNDDETYNIILDIFNEHGRGKTFNLLLDELDLNKQEDVLNLVYIYRYHFPNIKPYEDSLHVLSKLKVNFKLGLITDGRVFVQKRKVDALDIGKYFDTIIFTDLLGEKFWKPSQVPFQIALNNLDSNASESIYVGDDPYKDFKAPIELGMKTIQVTRDVDTGYWKDKGFNKYDAEISIKGLNDLLEFLEIE